MALNQTRRCKKCGSIKRLTDFYKHPSCVGGRLWECKSCKCSHSVLNWRRRYYKNNYGITIKEYEQMLQGQGGGCAICGRTRAEEGIKKHLAVDHDHETKKVRGILCECCNRALGLFRHDPSLLSQAKAYLEK